MYLPLLVVDINATNITNPSWLIKPLVDTLGTFAWPFVYLLGFLIVIGNITEDRVFIVFLYLALVSLIGYTLFDPIVTTIMLLFTAMVTGFIFYLGLYKKGSGKL